MLLATVSAVLLLSYCVEDENVKKKKKKKPRRIWVKPWIQERDRLGAYNALICEFTLGSGGQYITKMRSINK